MKFSIGDRVVLKPTGEEGYVVSQLGANMLEVDVNGITFPVYMEDVDHPYLKWFTEKQVRSKKSEPSDEPPPVEKKPAKRLPQGVHLSFLPVYRFEQMEDIVDQVRIYLLNELPHATEFHYSARLPSGLIFQLEATLHAFGDLFLHSIDYATMNDQPRFHWQLTPIEGKKKGPSENGVLRIRPQRLFEHITALQQNNLPTFSYLLVDGFVEKAEKPLPLPSFKSDEPTPEFYQARPFSPIIDLHIEELVENYEGMSTAEILHTQIGTFRDHLQLAIAQHQPYMVAIHGLGKGTLRDAVHAMLKDTPEAARFANEWHGKYGFGATEVWFKY